MQIKKNIKEKKDSKISRREFAKKAAAVCGAGTVGLMSMEKSLRAAPKIPSEQKNVLLLIADDHGLGELGCYGNPVINTSSLDRLAENGVRFSSAFATAASCSASRSVIYSGLFNHTNGQFGHMHSYNNQHTHSWVRGIPNLLNKNGYKTGIIEKFHVQPKENYDFQQIINVKGGGRNVYGMAQEAKKFFNTDRDKPFFLTIGYTDPHRDWVNSNKKEYPGIREVTYSPDDVIIPPFLPDEPEVREEFTEYYKSVSRLDQGIGYVLDYLKKSGRYEDTLIIYISDNGIPFPGAKTTLYDPGIKLPMIISSPTLRKRGFVNNAMVSWIDILPTIVDWTGCEKPPYNLPGRSFMPVLNEENPKGWDTVFASHVFHEVTMYYPMRVIRTRKYKYIRNLAHQLDYPFASDLYASPTWQGVLRRNDKMIGARSVDAYIHRAKEELYDLENDPNEVNNIAGNIEYAGILDDLRARLKKFQEDTNDPWIVKYKYE